MRYRVHRLEAQEEKAREELEEFLNRLTGEVQAIVPYVSPIFRLMGATAKTKFLLIVEKVR